MTFLRSPFKAPRRWVRWLPIWLTFLTQRPSFQDKQNSSQNPSGWRVRSQDLKDQTIISSGRLKRKRRRWVTTFRIHIQITTVLLRISVKFWGGRIPFCKNLRGELTETQIGLIVRHLQWIISDLATKGVSGFLLWTGTKTLLKNINREWTL